MIKTNEQMRKATVEAPRSGAGVGHFTYLLESDEMLDSCTMFAKIVLEPGSRVGRHSHVEDAEVYYILSGTMQVDDDGEMRTVFPGDAVYTSNGEFHSIENIGDSDAEMLAVVFR